ncbi:MAG: SoxR reducing system RseC family protein [Candidatus Thiodiazotropha sp. (ex Lucinoma borealis)]|nr:SoxR reducing system RseC family protein [Candidatus Thiodiazotropha sp. (ex Lucinoma borealis)]
MIEEPATVISLENDFAIVETQQRAACGSCSSVNSCSTTVLSGLFKRRHNRLKVANPIQARPGEQVIIGLQEQALLKVSFIAYLLPLVCMILVAILVQSLATQFAWQGGELPQVIGGLLGLISGFLLLKRLAEQRRDKPGYQPVILRQAKGTPVQFSKEYVG